MPTVHYGCRIHSFALSRSLFLSLSLFAIDAPKYCTCRLQSDAGHELQRKSERNCALNQSLYSQSREKLSNVQFICQPAEQQLRRHHRQYRLSYYSVFRSSSSSPHHYRIKQILK